MASYETLLGNIVAEWNTAEGAIKIAEQVNGEIVNPAIYELRYAGRRIVEAIVLHAKGDDQKAERILDDALFNCHRARHDAIDAITSKIVSDMDAAKTHLGANILLDKFPETTRLLEMLVPVRERIAESRVNRENRDAIYAVIEATDLPPIVQLYRKFKISEPLLEAAAEEQERNNRNNRVFGWVGIAVGVLSVIVPIIMALFSTK